MRTKFTLILPLLLSGCAALDVPAICPFQYDAKARALVESEIAKKYNPDTVSSFKTEEPITFTHYSDGVDIMIAARHDKLFLYEGHFVVQINPCTGNVVQSYYRGINKLYETK